MSNEPIFISAIGLCETHIISRRICGCATPADATPEARDTERDYTAEPLGKATRGAVRGVVELCPECQRNGVHVVVCARRGRRHDIWVHEAVITSVGSKQIGYTSHDTCHRHGPPPVERKRRVRKKKA